MGRSFAHFYETLVSGRTWAQAGSLNGAGVISVEMIPAPFYAHGREWKLAAKAARGPRSVVS